MIELVYQNGNVFVFNINAWEYLRKHRIIGEFCGQNQTEAALPLKLLPEEVFVSLKKNLAVLVKYESMDLGKDGHPAIEYYKHVETNLLQAERKVLKESKRKLLETYIDNIVKAKREKGDTRTKDEILNEEVDKATSFANQSNMIWPILLETPDVLRGEKSVITLNEAEELLDLNKISCKIFEDLWDRKLYITSGNKFGGDYLGYKGDPLVYHAMYIVHCLNSEDKINLRELVAWGRLGSSVKKRVLLSTVKEENVKYLTLSWLNS